MQDLQYDIWMRWPGPLDDLLVLNLTTMIWTDLSSVFIGTPPSPRFHHGFSASEGRLYVFGGSDFRNFSGAYDNSGPSTTEFCLEILEYVK